jgi:hypothetical protein
MFRHQACPESEVGTEMRRIGKIMPKKIDSKRSR